MQSLAQFPILSEMTESQIQKYNHRCNWKTYDPGELIIDHMEQSTDVRFIASGSVRIVVRMMEGREVIFNDFGPGQFFGELSAIDGGHRSANVSAQTRTSICIMPQSAFREMCIDAPKVGWQVMLHLVEMVRNLSDRLAEFTFLKAKHRLYSELLRQSRPREGHPQQRIISPMPVQTDIADRISSRREIVSRDMKDLERQSVIARERGGLVILDPDALSRLAADGWLNG